jgi:ABC-2 type transport system ATP-binding protein
MAAIETTALTKTFGDVVAVDALDLTVEEGEVFGFLGPNGAGKSTTIDILLDYTRPTSGRAEVLGLDAQADTMAVRERVGVLPENRSLYDRLSGRRHLKFALESSGYEATPEAIDDLLARVGLSTDDSERPAGDYSTGMQQRLSLGMALAGEPELLILDEPTSGLDPNGIREMRDLIHEERDAGTTVFFSSHILEQVEAVCDRVGILAHGQLQAVDTLEGLRETNASSARLTLTVDSVPEVAWGEVAGVSEVAVDGQAIEITCTEDRAKARAINRVQDAGATVLDIGVEETSLEDLFRRYTTGAPSGVPGEREEVPA